MDRCNDYDQNCHRQCQEADYPYEWTEDEAEELTSSCYANSSHQGSPQSACTTFARSKHLHLTGSPSSQHSSDFKEASSRQTCEDEKMLGSLEHRFPFLKEERKRTRKLLSPEQTRVLEAILEKTVYPSTPLREAVARQLGIAPRKVQIWFQNKRQGRRRSPSTSSKFGNVTVQRHRQNKQQSSYEDSQSISAKEQQRQWKTVSGYSTTSPSSQIALSSRHRNSMRKRTHSDSTDCDRNQRSTILEKGAAVLHSDRQEYLSKVGLKQESISPTSHASFPVFGKSDSPLSHYLPMPKQSNSRMGRPFWSSLHDRPSPLAFDQRSDKSSNDSITSVSSSYRGDDWSLRFASLSSSSTRTAFSEAATSIRSERGLELLSSHCSSSPFASAQDEKLQLAPIDLDAAAAHRHQALPSISELILV